MDRFGIATGKVPPPPEARSLEAIIDKIKALIPADFNPLFVEQLSWVKRNALYKAPEQQPECWRLLQRLLIEFIPRPNEEWEFQVLAAFSTQDIDLIKVFWKKEHTNEVIVSRNGLPCLATVTGVVER